MIHQSFASWAKQQEVKRFLLAVLKKNQSALGFWIWVGYKIIKEFPSRKIGRREHQLIELEYRLVEPILSIHQVLHSLDEEKMSPRRKCNAF
jgi:hypothetical protein